ncbi:hypothetical protein B0H17DRAFT_1057858 [Mycena rosella]|uniref:Uncharacterized protein n=1 Tax=Mycena rosella TaxID=1033263 RepID=A0AAD7DLJ5_MYCRO|nr:hypothetical protein B0H17DRAFT_1057858 [Mycena rosella]
MWTECGQPNPVSRQPHCSVCLFTLYLHSMAFPSSPLFAPSFQIIVVPPAEDFQPDYLVFNADEEPDLATRPDFASLDDALNRITGEDPPPTFTRTSVDTVIMPRRGDPRPEQDVADETVREDSEIVEVVKVRRAFAEEPSAPPPPKPKSTSLRSRASRAFRSIKNVARSSSRNSKPYTQDMFASSQSTQATFASVARSSSRNSRPYAQDMFASSQSTQATFASVPLPAPPAVTPPPLARRGSIILTQLFRAPSPAEVPASATLDFLPSPRYSDDDDDDDDDRESIAPRAPSPSPSARTFSSTVRRRLSIFNFQRKVRTDPPRPSSPPTLSRGSTLPSTSSAPQTPTEESYPLPPPSPPTLSRGSTLPSTSSAPQTPTEESYPLPPPPIAKDAADDPDLTVGEMRLDSLHFESLSFDADNF